MTIDYSDPQIRKAAEWQVKKQLEKTRRPRMELTRKVKAAKLKELALQEMGSGDEDNLSETVYRLLEEATYDVPLGICSNENCTYYTVVEPDQDKGWCEHCETNTVVSCLILGNIV